MSSRLPPSCLPAGCVGIPLSMRKQSQSFLRRSKRATTSLSLPSGMTFLSQVSMRAEAARETILMEMTVPGMGEGHMQPGQERRWCACRV